MISQQNMLRTLESLRYRLENGETEGDGVDFCRFYDETRQALRAYAQQEKSRFIAEKTNALPDLHPSEVTEHISLFAATLGMLPMLGATVRKKAQAKKKKTELLGLLQPIIAVITTPGLDELYYNAESTHDPR